MSAAKQQAARRRNSTGRPKSAKRSGAKRSGAASVGLSPPAKAGKVDEAVAHSSASPAPPAQVAHYSWLLTADFQLLRHLACTRYTLPFLCGLDFYSRLCASCPRAGVSRVYFGYAICVQVTVIKQKKIPT